MNNNVMAAETFDKKRVYFYECDYCGRFKISEILKLAAELAGCFLKDFRLKREINL